MSEILRKWLTHNLGIVLELSADQFGKNARDGRLIAHILHNYDIISSVQLSVIVPTDDPDEAKKNLSHIKIWLNNIDVHCDDAVYDDIANGKSSAAIQLFYQMYLIFESPENLYITQNKRLQPYFLPTESNTRFEVHKVKEELRQSFERNPLAKPIHDQQELIQKYKKKYQAIEKKIRGARKNCAKFFQNKYITKKPYSIPETFDVKPLHNPLFTEYDRLEDDKKRMYQEFCQTIHKFDLNESKSYTYNELLNQIHIGQTTLFKQPDDRGDDDIKKINQKNQQITTARKYKRKLESKLMQDLWNNILTKQELEFDKQIAEKTLKQSEYEKQIVTKCFDVQNQKNIIRDNRQLVENLIKQRREDDFNHAVLLRVEELQRTKCQYDFECERNIQLHRKLRKVQQQTKKTLHFNISSDVIDAIVDMAIKTSDYKHLHRVDVPQYLLDKWRQLFLSCQQLYDYLEHVEAVINETPGPVEKTIQMEYDRQSILNDNDLFEYTNYLGPWQLRILFKDYPIEIDESVLNESYTLIGIIVHRLLSTKYPIPPSLLSPKLPKFNIKAAVTNITDHSLMRVLRDLLKRADVTIIEAETAIKYVLECFQQEMLGIEDIEIKFYNETAHWIESYKNVTMGMIPDSKNKNLSEKSRQKHQALLLKKKWTEKSGTRIKTSKHQILSTDRASQTFSDSVEKQDFTEAVMLGKRAYECLVLGKPINDHLMASIIIKYLQTLNDCSGYVLLNYPRTLKQAVILEHKMTAKIPKVNEEILSMTSPNDVLPSIENLLINQSDLHIEKDPYRNKRISNLVPNPNSEVKTYKDHSTFFTVFITARKEKKLVYENRKPTEMYDEGTPLEKFYTNEGVQYILYYEKLDFETIVYLAKLIISDFSMPLKKSTDLFGSKYEELQQIFSKKDDKKENEINKTLPYHLKSTSEVTSSGKNSETKMFNPLQAGDEFSKIGDKRRYARAVLNPSFAISLATLWENMETTYLNDIKELFFIKRANRESIMPYCTHVKDHMSKFIHRPDNKQSVLQEFQYYYNSINNDLRDDTNVQAELHYRVTELRNKLWDLCDERFNENENERQRLIKCHWATDQLVLLTNLFINLMQIELNRSADTLQVIQDYYSSIANGRIEVDEVIPKIKLQKVETVQRQFESMESIPPKYSYNWDTRTFTSDGKQIYDTMVQLLIKSATSTFSEAPFMNFIKKNQQLALQHIKSWILKLTESQLGSTGAGITISASKTFTPPPKRGPIDDESHEAIDIELKRIGQRIKAIKRRAEIDLEELFECCTMTFYTIDKQIETQYQNEIRSVKTVCKMFDKAIIDQIKIQNELILDDQDFLVYRNTLLYPSPKSTEAISPISEQIREGEFTHEQLRHLFRIFYELAPNGSIPERVFIFTFQDLIFSDAEDGFHESVPLLWKNVEPQKVTSILSDMFGDSEFVDWRDFLIYNMGLRFPTEHEILNTWMECRLYDPQRKEIISKNYYNNVHFWFEKDSDMVVQDTTNAPGKTSMGSIKTLNISLDPETTTKNPQKVLRISLLKDLLFEMFQVDEHCTNYTGLLLAFCKDENPVMGLVKAFTLTLNSLIGWDPVLGEDREKQDILERYSEKLQEVEQTGEENDSIFSKYNCLCGDTTILNNYSSSDEPRSIYSDSSENMLPSLHDSIPSFTLTNIILPSSYSQKQNQKSIPTQLELQQQYFKNHSFVSIALAHTYLDSQLEIYNNRVYLLPLEAILVTIAATFPWHIRVACIENQSLRHLLEKIHASLFEAHTHRAIYAYKFLQHPILLNMLNTCFKFHAFYPPDIVKKYL